MSRWGLSHRSRIRPIRESTHLALTRTEKPGDFFHQRTIEALPNVGPVGVDLRDDSEGIPGRWFAAAKPSSAPRQKRIWSPGDPGYATRRRWNGSSRITCGKSAWG